MKPVMDDNQILDLLEELAESLGLEISHEPIRLDEELGTRREDSVSLRAGASS